MSIATAFLIFTFFGLVNANPISTTTESSFGIGCRTCTVVSIHTNTCPPGQVWNGFYKICTGGSQFPAAADSNDPFDYDNQNGEQETTFDR